ncbi:MAG TPA: tyrosine-type recombinase/integrase [Spirillospora sp.]|nr:tyrosine-type recombinase/integrase [Spirillospora sp.]
MPTIDPDIADHIAWCADLRGLTPATIRVRRWVLNRLAISADRPLRDCQVGHLLVWEQTFVAGLAPESRRCYVQHVISFYAWLQKTGRISHDPTEMLTRPKLPKPLPRPITETDLKRAINAASPKLTAMLCLMAYCGLRAMECANLLWTDIEVADGQTWIRIRGKGNKERMVPAGEVVQRALRRHGTRMRGPVFIGRDGRQMRPNSVSQVVNEHLHRLGIRSSAHKLRARYATQAAKHCDLSLVAQLLGWTSLNTARHYIKPDSERSLKLVAALDALAATPVPRTDPAPTGARPTERTAAS